jgi:hypothetical protein
LRATLRRTAFRRRTFLRAALLRAAMLPPIADAASRPTIGPSTASGLVVPVRRLAGNMNVSDFRSVALPSCKRAKGAGPGRSVSATWRAPRSWFCDAPPA